MLDMVKKAHCDSTRGKVEVKSILTCKKTFKVHGFYFKSLK